MRLALADVKETARHLGGTLNDIVLATAAGALRELQLRYDGKADAPLIAGVPVSYNTSPQRLVGNEFSYLTPSLPVHIADPLERVRLTATATSEAASGHPTACVPRAWRHIADVVASSRIVPDGLMSGTPRLAVTPDEPDRLQRAATTTVSARATMKTMATS